MDGTTALLTGLGLAGAAGLNAYVPLLVVGVLASLGAVTLSGPYADLTNPWLLAVLALLLAVEFLADKIPGVDSVNDVVQTVVRIGSGAVLFAGSVGLLSEVPPWVGIVAGGLTAGGVHAVKATARPVVNVSTAGAGGPVVSLVEDVVSLVTSLVAVLAPLLVVVLLVVALLLLRRLWRRVRRRAAPPDPGPALPAP